MENIRKEYSRSILSKTQVDKNPLNQFKIWFEETLQSDILEPTAMILSTVGQDLKPSSRVVLLKNILDDGFVFFTNFQSRKASELQMNANACLLFFWDKLERQIRIEGHVKTLDETLSDQYFYSRPILNQIGSMISPQSQMISDRTELEEKFMYFQANPDKIKRPEHWGGFCLVPAYFEFWQGRTSRLHDRIIYQQINNCWEIARLAP